MKPKPISHKNDNTFKFESFNERLNKINISTISHLKRRFDGVDEDEDLSYFAIALEKWQDLNCTQDYKDLRKKIGSSLDVQSLAQIIHQKNKFVEILLDGLRDKENKAINAILDLIVALARDLQSDFYEFFPDIFKLLVDLVCDINDVEIIEAIFVCQTFLFKYLWKPILKDITKHYQTIQKALKCKKEYVLNFSSEVFSFLIRKSTKPQELFQMIFESLTMENDLSKGVGRILFESIKGVNQCFNSKSKVFLDIIFQHIALSQHYSVNLLAMEFFISNILQYASTTSFKLVWSNVLPASSNISNQHVHKYVPIIFQIVSYKNCKFVLDSNLLLQNLTELLSNTNLDLEFHQKVLQSIEKLFLNKHQDLSTEIVIDFAKKFYKNEMPNINLDNIFAFTKNVIQSPIFEQHIDVFCYALCQKILCSHNEAQSLICLNFLASLVVYKKPKPLFGRDLHKIAKYSIKFEDCDIIMKILCEYLKNSNNLKLIWLSLLIIPHLMPIENPNNICHLIKVHVLENFEQFEKKDYQTTSLIGNILMESIFALILLKSHRSIVDEISTERIVELFIKNSDCLEFALALDIYLSYNKSISLDFSKTINEYLKNVYDILQNNFSCPYRLNRIVSLHIMTLFDLTLPKNVDKEEVTSVFQVCIDAELVPMELAVYRDRLKHIQKLDCRFVSASIPEPIFDINFEMAPVYFLLGTLYENLSLLWKPTLEVLETYARLLKNKKLFSDIVLGNFKTTNSLIVSPCQHRFNIFKEYLDLNVDSEINNFSFTPDHINHRDLLLKGFKMFSEVIEPRNREFVEFFFLFINSEISSYHVCGITRNQNIKLLNEDIENDEINETENNAEQSNSKMLWKTLFSFLEVLAKFKNPKSLFREAELLELYLNMLLSPNSSVQKHAMNCLFTYNHSYLVKYKDNFLKLIDDKTFSSEIQSFIVHDNAEDNVLIAEDREKVIPLFLRILYGKMLSSWGTKVHGKSKIDFLRSIILKVLSSFDENEQIMFMDLIYMSVNKLVSIDYDQFFVEIDSFINIESFIPFKQFKSFITTLDFLMKHFGSKSTRVMQYMYKLLIVCSSIVSCLLSAKHRLQIKDYIVNSLKSFRTNCFNVAIYFFSHFDKYCFTANEIDALFVSLINPLLSSLESESLNAPTPLLRLFGKWAENPRLYVLFAKQAEQNNQLTSIEAIINLYSHPKISPTTTTYITTIIEHLLTFKEIFDCQDENYVAPIEINNFGKPLPHSNNYPEFKDQDINFGSLLLIPYISKILERIKLNYSLNVSSNAKFVFTLQEINVMARLSFFVISSNDSKIISTLLLHSISQTRRMEEDKEVFTLKTLNHLAKNLAKEDFFEMLRLSFPLFMLIDKPLSRKELCNFLLTLSLKNDDFVSLAKMVNGINSYDSRLPEEPDYGQRIASFKQILLYLDSCVELNTLQLDFIQLLTQNCSFFINTYEDMSLRELSSNVFVKIGSIFKDSNSETFNRYIMNLLFYKIISRGFKHQKESARNEYIGILVSLIKIFPLNRHVVIDQLRSLCNDQDDEVDFWQNIKHIQMHRRARALTRLTQDSALLASLSSRVYLNFLVPLVTNFISASQASSKNVTLLNASIDSLGTFLQYCSWFKYDSTLSYYVNGLLENKIDQKIAIHVISTLLEKFSFLKQADVARIESELNTTDFNGISLEYSFVGEKKSKNKNKQPKKQKRSNKKNKDQPKPSKDAEHLSSMKENENPQHIPMDTTEVSTDIKSTIMDVDIDMTKEDQLFESAKPANIEYQRKIYNSLCKKLLPLLHKCLHQKSQIDYMYDSYKEEFPEDDEIQRIPIALAIVKLLKHIQLNEQLLKANLNSIFLRLCQFLQSRTESIREASRNTFVKILQTLGPKYFSLIFYEMRSLLCRGYQRHVFIYTVYILLINLTSQLSSGDLDSCMHDIIEMCHLELFGNLGEEKEISHIVTKTKEAKKLKGYDIYEILGQFVSETFLTNMLNPLRDVLTEANSHKVMKKVEKAFYKIGRGLVSNKFISVSALMTVLGEIMSNTLPDNDKSNETPKVELLSKKLPIKIDSFLIPQKAFRRDNQVSKINRTSNSYILSQFSLTCYFYMLKNNRLLNTDSSHKEILDSTLVYLKSFLHSHDVQVVTTSMHCIHSLLVKFPDLPSFQQITQDIISQIFVLLNKYSGINNENSQLMVLCFKTIGYFINTRMECKLTDEEISVLLSYAAKDIENNSQNSTIYFLLKSIIYRKFKSKELHVLMEKLVVLAITTEIDYVRTHAIELSIKYLTEYPIEPTRFKGKIVKLVKQLEYHSISGRLAAITILKHVINLLTYETIEPIKNHIFVPLSSRLVNEESPECKKLVADTIIKVLSKLSPSDRDDFFETFILPWLSSDLILAQTLASALCSLYVTYEKQNFETRLASCLPLIRQQLDPTRFVSLKDTEELEEENKSDLKNEDNLVFNHLNFILKLFKLENSIQLLTKLKYFDDFNDIFENVVQSFLLHPHSWIRCLATQLIGQIFSLFSPESFIHDLNIYKNCFFFQNTDEKFFQMSKKFCLIFRDLYNCESVSEQLVKNLIYIARVVILFDSDDNKAEGEIRKATLKWLISKLLFEVKFEIKNFPDQVEKQLLFFKWIAAVSLELGSERIVPYLPNLLPPICRQDLTHTAIDHDERKNEKQHTKEELANLSKQVLQLIRNLIGSEQFIDHYNAVRSKISHKRLERRKQRAIQMVTQMVAGVKRKQRKHKRSQVSKRRKMTPFKVT